MKKNKKINLSFKELIKNYINLDIDIVIRKHEITLLIK